jgi:hypothetical protein
MCCIFAHCNPLYGASFCLQLNFTRGRNWTQLTVHLAVNLLDRYLSAILKAPPATDAASPPTAARTTRSGVVPVAAVKKSPAPKPTGPRLSDPAHRVVLTATMLWVSTTSVHLCSR